MNCDGTLWKLLKLQNPDPDFKTHFTIQSYSQTDFDSTHDSEKGIASF